MTPRPLFTGADDPIREFFKLLVQMAQSQPSPPVSATVAETLFLTVREAATWLGLPQAEVRRAIAAGELPARQMRRGGWRIRRRDLELL